MRNEILTRDELLNLERLKNSDTIASMNFLGLPVICLSINFTINALNELAAQVFHSSVNELVGANFRELCAKYQLDFPIFSQKKDILAGEVVQDFSQWMLGAEKDAIELKWSIIRHLDRNYQPSGFILVMTHGFQDIACNLQADQQVSDGNNFRVLLIEDNPVCQSIAKSLFEDLFCDITIANTAQQALEYLHNNYDIIFLDISLPGKDGIALAGELRRRLQLKIPIVATTGYAWDVNRYKEVGINDYIRKPLTKIKLQKALMKFL
ncbi:MAG: response regulator [Gammaproteobacteria bacterium]|jgi:CheY-like chemotaxis protein